MFIYIAVLGSGVMFESAPSLMISQVIFPQFNKESSAGKQKTAGVLSLFPKSHSVLQEGAVSSDVSVSSSSLRKKERREGQKHR